MTSDIINFIQCSDVIILRASWMTNSTQVYTILKSLLLCDVFENRFEK